MPTKSLSLAGLLCLSALLFQCTKDHTREEESPFFDFFKDAGITIDTVAQAADTWDYGFTFTPIRDGKVTSFGIKLPTSGDFKVTLWDLSGSTPVEVHTQSVSLSSLTETAQTAVPDLAVKKGRKYGITIHANTFFRVTRPGNLSFNFPRTIGNLRIDSFNEGVNNDATPMFPPSSNDTRVAPCVNVIFIAD